MKDKLTVKVTPHGIIPESKLNQALLIFFIFLLVELILINFHGVWGDEVHSWAIAMSSHSLPELIHNTRFEGHPKLWYLLLFILQIFTGNIYYMQILHVIIAASTVFVISYFSPFKFWKNVLICSGYFFTFEYSIISRNYGIELLLLFLCAGIYTHFGGKKLILLSFLFFLLFQTNIYAVIIGFPFYVYIIYNLYKEHLVKINRLIISALIIITGIIVSVIAVRPPTDTIFTTIHFPFSVVHFLHVMSTIVASYLPFPQVNLHFWSSNFLNITPEHVFRAAFLSFLLLILITILFKADGAILLLFYTGLSGVLLFTYISNFGWLRHHGHMYILFILCYWLYSAKKRPKGILWRDKYSEGLNKYFVTFLLLVQVAAGICANCLDVEYTFSNDKPVADYLKKNSLDTLPVLGKDDYSVSGIAGIMNKDIYFFYSGKWERWIELDSNWKNTVQFSPEQLVRQTEQVMEDKKSDVIVILRLPGYEPNLSNWKLLKSFENSSITEDYSVYYVKYIPPDPANLISDGKYLVSQGQMSDAIELFTKATRLKPGYIEAFMNLAACYDTSLHDYENAIANIDSAEKYAPLDYTIDFDKGAILLNKGDSVQALVCFNRTIQLNPGFTNGYWFAALCNYAGHKYKNAISDLNNLLKLDPNNEPARRMLANCYKMETTN